MIETELNLMGTPVPTADWICTSCKLARMLESGVIVDMDHGHQSCEGEGGSCRCGCEYSLGIRCKECGRKGTALDIHGQCADRRDCANAIAAAYAVKTAERRKRAAVAPPKKTGGRAQGSPRDCKCGCGEKTGGGLYRPGHDARHVSNLVAHVKAGELDVEAARDAVAHSDKLVAKLEKAIGYEPPVAPPA